ncbi:MAG: hypothetical protein IJ272_03710 [Clostridia bacterium]|nr:hypothetical protein [Clostridia bacterium]
MWILELAVLILLFIHLAIVIFKDKAFIWRIILYSIVIALEIILLIAHLVNGGAWILNLVILLLQTTQLCGVIGILKRYGQNSVSDKKRECSNRDIVV